MRTPDPPAPARSRARHRSRDEAGRLSLVLVAMAVLVAVGVGLLARLGTGPFPDPEGCTASVEGVDVDLTTEQAENAGLIAAIGVRRGLPARAVSIALATAFQESKLRNLPHGDRDSLGLFQQRPSQGWGTPEEILDPTQATNKFYDALIKVDGYEDMRITEAAQAVQRSGFPEAYEQHAEGARALASALTGWSPATFSCVVDEPEVDREPAGKDALSARTQVVRRDLTRVVGPRDTEVVSPTSFTVSMGDERRNWALASYLVSQAARLDLALVAVDGHGWRSGPDSERGWVSGEGAAARSPEDGSVLVTVARGA